MEAIKTFEKLEREQYRTGWVLCQVARAHFEMVNYTEVTSLLTLQLPALSILKAQRIFEEVRRFEPERTSDMEIYSTMLWHLRKVPH